MLGFKDVHWREDQDNWMTILQALCVQKFVWTANYLSSTTAPCKAHSVRCFLLPSAISVETRAQAHTCSHLPSPKVHGGLTLRYLKRTALWVSLPVGQHCWACKECFTFYKPLGTRHRLCLRAHEEGFLTLYIHLHLLWLNLIRNAELCAWKHCQTLWSHQFSGEGNTLRCPQHLQPMSNCKERSSTTPAKDLHTPTHNYWLTQCPTDTSNLIFSFMSRKERIHGKTVKWSVENGCKLSRFPRITRITSWRGKKINKGKIFKT